MGKQSEGLTNFLNMIRDRVMESKRANGGCFVSIKENSDHYDVDVEVSAEKSAGSFISTEKSLEVAEVLMAQVVEAIEKEGCKVFKTKAEWKAALGA
jgi:hypothetical protein